MRRVTLNLKNGNGKVDLIKYACCNELKVFTFYFKKKKL